MELINYELGEWVGTENGYGQIMYIRTYFVEEYENKLNNIKKGKFIKFIYICKILCDFNGKLKKNQRIKAFTVIDKIDKKGLFLVQKIKGEQTEEYMKYISYEDKQNITQQLFRSYLLDDYDFNKENISQIIKKINDKLYPSFTYNEFKEEIKNYELPFKIENIISYGDGDKETITLRFDSQLYKTKGKEVIFDNVKVI